MNEYIINQLDQNKVVFEQLLKTSGEEEYLFKPEANKWCLLEIICHLVDEEVHDFRARVRTALNEKEHPFYAIDPVGWVSSRKYMEQDYKEKIGEWIAERDASIRWLRSLQNPDWSSSFKTC